MQNNNMKFGKVYLRPKFRRGPQKGITAVLLLALSVAVVWLGFLYLIDLELIENPSTLGLAVAGIMAGIIGSCLSWLIGRNLFNQGRKSAQQQGGW